MSANRNELGYKIVERLMRISGIWPCGGRNVLHKFRTYQTCLTSVALVVAMSFEIAHVRNDFVRLSEIAYVMVTATSYNFKLFNFLWHRKKFVGLLQMVESKVFNSHSRSWDEMSSRPLRLVDLANKTYLCLAGAVIVGYASIPLLDNKLPFPFPYDLGRFRPAFYVFQVYGLGTAAWNNSCLDGLAVGLASIAIGHLGILEERLKKVAAGGEEKVVDCIDYHLAITKLVDSIETVFTFGIFIQFLGSTIAICNTLLNIILISEFNTTMAMMVTYLVVMLLQLYMYCWFGNELMWRSVSVGDACYMSKWYDCDGTVKKHLLRIIQRSHRPLSITTLRFTTVSLRTFTLILQWCYSYFAMLMHMYRNGSFGRNFEN